MPSQNEIRWSQLRVGVLVSAAVVTLIVLIFLMTGSTGGLFTRKVKLICYLPNAAGLKSGAPVTLQGVTLGNVTKVKVIHGHKPNSVLIEMTVNDADAALLHTDTAASIAQAGVLGDSYIDLDSSTAVGPPPHNGAELPYRTSSSIQEVIDTSKQSIEDLHTLVDNLNTLTANINAGKGTVGKVITDPALYNKLNQISGDLSTITNLIANGKGSLGKFVNDDSLYNHANSAVTHLDNITAQLDAGHGTVGKLIHDESLYNNLNESIGQTNQLLKEINSGKGTVGKLVTDPATAQKLDDTITHLDTLLKGIEEGKGTLGQLATNRSLYDHTDKTLDEASQLVNGMRTNPKKYLVIHLKLF